MRWMGPSWNAGVNAPEQQVSESSLGQVSGGLLATCHQCEARFAADDQALDFLFYAERPEPCWTMRRYHVLCFFEFLGAEFTGRVTDRDDDVFHFQVKGLRLPEAAKASVVEVPLGKMFGSGRARDVTLAAVSVTPEERAGLSTGGTALPQASESTARPQASEITALPRAIERTAYNWADRPVYCPTCNGPTRDLEDEYGGLSDGGNFQRFECLKPGCKQPTIYVELPD